MVAACAIPLARHAGLGVWQAGAEQRELGPSLEPVLGVREAQLARVVERGAVADGDQHVLEPMAGRLGVVDLVGDDRGQARFVGEPDELGDEPVVVGEQVVGQLHAEVPVGKVAGPPFRRGTGGGPLPGQQPARDLPFRQPLSPMRWPFASSSAASSAVASNTGNAFSPARWPADTIRDRAAYPPGRGPAGRGGRRGRTGVVPRPAAAGLRSAEWERHAPPAPRQAQLALIAGMASSTPRIGTTGERPAARASSVWVASAPFVTAGPPHTARRGR